MGRPKLWTSGSRGISEIMYWRKKWHVSNGFNWVRIYIKPLITCWSGWHLSHICMIMMPPPLWIEHLGTTGDPKPKIGFKRVMKCCELWKIIYNWHKISWRFMTTSIKWSAVTRWETWYNSACNHTEIMFENERGREIEATILWSLQDFKVSRGGSLWVRSSGRV